MNHIRIVLVAALLSGCEAKVDDLQIFIAEVKQTTSVNIELYPEFESKPTFIYSANTLRSPFRRPRNTGVRVKAKVASQSNCAQPDFNHSKQPLEKFGIDALSITGVFQYNGKKFKATIGDYLGLFFGKIDSIQNGTVSFTEMLPDGAGCWQKKQATLTMLSKAGEDDV
jgi:type IV pilus assembly protein PilP